MPKHLLVTNDFPPKVGGIQNYLFELWSRLDPDSFAVYTTPYDGASEFDASLEFQVIRSKEPWLGPFPWLPRRLRRIASQVGADRLIVDPAWPLGFIAPNVGLPYAAIIHGAEAIIPSRIPGLKLMFQRAINGADFVIGGSHYSLESVPDGTSTELIYPGADLDRFKPNEARRVAMREKLGVADDEVLVVGISRLVKRKGFDVLIKALEDVPGKVSLVIAGDGRDRKRLDALVEKSSRNIRLLGRVSDEDITSLYCAADISAMICQSRWGGLEQEGFGIVFVEAAASGTPQVAGRSGGSHEAVAHGQTGLVVDDSSSPKAVAAAISHLVDNPQERLQMADRSPEHASQFGYDRLADQLVGVLQNWA